MKAIDKESADNIINSWISNENHVYMDIDEHLLNPLFDALGDDFDEAFAYLDGLNVETLDYVTGCFELIYKKWTTDDVWDKLEELENKIKNNAVNE